jgi:hypothetical protein
MFDLYIYYQVADAVAPGLQAVVRAMQTQLAHEHGVGTALKRRPESEQGLQTWMEIYTGAGPAFGDDLARASAAAGIDSLVEGIRHTEVFTEMSPCA